MAKCSAHLEAVFQTQPIWRWGFSLSPFGGGVSVSAHLEAVFQTLAHLEAVSGSASWWLGRAHLGHPCLWAVFQLAVASAFSLLVAVGIPMGGFGGQQLLSSWLFLPLLVAFSLFGAFV